MVAEIEKVLKGELGDKLLFNESLSNYVSMKVGGPARFLYETNEIDDLVKAVTTAYNLKIPSQVLGWGSNVIPSDAGFDGLIIINHCSNVAFSGDTSEVIVDSGAPLSKVINLAAGRDLGGLEFLYGIPGSVGGAVYGNAGAFNYEIGDFVKSVILLIEKNEKITIVKRDNEWMRFSYRSSRLKEEFSGVKKPIILTVKLQLVRRRRDEIVKFMQDNLKQKTKLQPLDEKSAGCFFKNPSHSSEGSAGYMLDLAGAKKLRVGGASISKKHANFIINRKNATAKDIRELANKSKELVFEKFNKTLEEEIEFIGEWQ